jgi:hypothetical protein
MFLCAQCENDDDGSLARKDAGAIPCGKTIEEAVAKADALALRAATEHRLSTVRLAPSVRVI